ncbi:hypothetical protein [Schleiferilactobacillus harbinensis]|uniref:hypothetical protein n=1 Tax=Schleiferilactobacillus harbinensis TaxID=304207 RepID=UPI00116C84DB|nr:hypothetical protein [Schleiferilactobacillus harbinensis]GEK06431.1 hypothetical protein LHA01_16700 [Schleiferilactobacillus harbinensis]
MSFDLDPDELAHLIDLLPPKELKRIRKNLRATLIRDQINDELEQYLDQQDDPPTTSKSAKN